MWGPAPAEAKPRLARQSGTPWSLDHLSPENTRNPCRLQAGPGPAFHFKDIRTLFVAVLPDPLPGGALFPILTFPTWDSLGPV